MCRFFLNGGCIRGELCPYSHEFPDERHLDVNGVGFIFNTGVQNSGVAMQRRFQPPPQSSPQQPQPPAYHGRQQSPQPQPLNATAMPQQTPPQAPVRTPVASHPPYVAAPTYTGASMPTVAPPGIPVHYQPTSSIYTYGTPPAPQPAPGDIRAPPQAPPIMTSQVYVAAPMHLQPRNGTTAPISVVPRTDIGPYSPPTPFPYALPPQLTVAYQHASIVPVSSYAQPAMVYSYPAQQQAVYTAMMPTAASA